MIMKKIVLLALSVVWTFAVHGQDTTGYRSFFGQESTEWYGIVFDYDYYDYHVMRTVSDTLVDGLQYKVIKHFEILNGDGEYYERYEYSYLLREDTINGRLWCRYFNHDEDFLIVDMSLSVGDRIVLGKVSSPYSGTGFIVEAIIDTNTLRKIILKNATGREIYFIEGVGCSNIVEYSPYGSLGIESSLLCCVKDSVREFHDGPQEGCYGDPFVGIGMGDHQNILIYPNPCRDWIKIDGEGVNLVCIYNAQGQLEKSETNNSGIINVSDLPAGVYVLRIFSRDSIIDKKIIKQ